MLIRLFILFISLVTGQLAANNHLALVSVAPYTYMIEDITRGEVRVMVLVPAGLSLHTYEPTPKQILQAATASIWFTIGEQFEAKVIKALQVENPNLVVVDLREGLLLMEDDDDHHHKDSADPHVWMSPKMMQLQVVHIATSLAKVFPELAEKIEANKQVLLERLEALDQKIHSILKEHKGKVIFVSHPAYGYFCREYGLKQVSIEFEGKDPTPRHLHELLEAAKRDHITTIFVQTQYGKKAAELVAGEIGAKIIPLDPYSADYFSSMLHIAKSFAEAK